MSAWIKSVHGLGHREVLSPSLKPDWFGARHTLGANTESGMLVQQAYNINALMPDASAAISQPIFSTQTLSIAEVVIGIDDRVQIHNTSKTPWKQICSLLIEAGDGSLWRGTGWITGPRTIITAGHCVFMHRHGGWVRSINIMPGALDSRSIFRSFSATTFRTVNGWMDDENEACDYGAIFLSEDTYLEEYGVLRFAEIIGYGLENHVVNLAGYPGDKPTDTLWWDSRTVSRVDTTHIYYEIDTTGGQSGAPVWLVDNEDFFVVGMHTLGNLKANSAVKISPAVFDCLAAWTLL